MVYLWRRCDPSVAWSDGHSMVAASHHAVRRREVTPVSCCRRTWREVRPGGARPKARYGHGLALLGGSPGATAIAADPRCVCVSLSGASCDRLCSDLLLQPRSEARTVSPSCLQPLVGGKGSVCKRAPTPRPSRFEPPRPCTGNSNDTG